MRPLRRIVAAPAPLWLGAGIVPIVGSVLLHSWLPAVLGALSVVAGGLAVRDRRRRTTSDTRRVAMQRFLGSVEAAVRSGRALGPAVRDAIAAVGDDHPALVELGARLEAGLPLASALDVESGDELVGLVATTLAVVADRGGAADAALSRLIDVIHAIDASMAEEAAASAQVRASAVVLVALPAVFAGIGVAVDEAIRDVYLHHPVGAVAVAAAGVLDLIGWRWIQGLVR